MKIDGYCPACHCNRESLPEPAEGTCVVCYNHLITAAPRLLFIEMSYVQKVSAKKLFPDAKLNDGYIYITSYDDNFELVVISRRKC